MTTPTEHKTVQVRILEYAEAIGWTFVSQKEAEQRRGFDLETPIKDRAKGRTLFFEDLLDAMVREFNPRYAEAEGALPGKFRHLHTDIYGNLEFSAQRCLNRKERKERIEDLGSESLRSLCSLRYFISEFRGFDRRERRDRKVDLDSGSLSSLRSLRLAISEFFDHEKKRERDLILKRKRRFRGLPDTAFRPRIPSPERLNHRVHRERKEDLDFESLSSLCSLRLLIHLTSNRPRPVPEMSFRTCGGRANFHL